MKTVKPNEKCPQNEKICITSPKCQECENYITHKSISDEHGRIEYYLVDCKVLN